MLTISHAVININTIHRLILSFLVLAIKYHDDVFYKMDYYATVGDLKFKKLTYLKYCYLILLIIIYMLLNLNLMSIIYN